MSPATTARLALAGSRTDLLRIALTGLTTALAVFVCLVVAAVVAIPDPPGDAHQNGRYQLTLLDEPGLRPGVVFILLLLLIPMLVLAGQSARLGAPARDRRLAAIRMAGATPGQAVLIAAAETVVASAVGSLVGLSAFLIARGVLDRPDQAGKLLLPTEVLPGVGILAAICLVIPAAAGLMAMLMLRAVAFTPFGVIRRVRTRGPRPWGAVVLLAGMGLAVLTATLLHSTRRVPDSLVEVLMLGTIALTVVGLLLNAASLAHLAGRLLHRFARGPAALLAASRLTSDPWSGSRTFGILMTTVFFASGLAAYRERMAADFRVSHAALEYEIRQSAALSGGQVAAADDSFYFNTLDALNGILLVATILAAGGMIIAVVEGVLSRRRSYTTQIAAGVPRGVLTRAILWQVGAPLVPAIAIATAFGVLLVRQLGTEVTAGDGSVFTESVVLPWARIGLVAAVGIAVAMAVAAVGALTLRTATAPEELRAT